MGKPRAIQKFVSPDLASSVARRVGAVASSLRFLLLAAAATTPSLSLAQAISCTSPPSVPRVHPEEPTSQEPQRILPIGGYTLAVSWSPERCYAHGRDPTARFECGGGARFGFTLHGLWPDGIGTTWPQYCKSTGLLAPRTITANMCATPSAQLLQHEWAKHGTCTGLSADSYFARSTGLYRKLVFPDVSTLGNGRSTNAGDLAAALARANPGLSASMMRITANRSGWLEEIWFCLDKQFAHARCKPNSGGVAPAETIRIARPRSSRSRDDAYRDNGG